MIIFKTTCVINNKIYIGKACGKRVNENYLGSGKILKQAIKKYGKESFKRTIIDFAESRKDQNAKETFWIAFYNARNSSIGYNILPGGEGGRNKGLSLSLETKSKISAAMKGKTLSLETRQRMRLSKIGEKNPMFGKKRVFSDIHLQNMSLARKGEKCVWYGRHHSEETKRKMSSSHQKHERV